MKGFYFITDTSLSRKGNISDVKNALAAGAEVVQYRNKTASTKEMYEEALKLRRICKDATFLINDRVDIALAVNADGVHLGGKDLPYEIARRLLGKKKTIGLTVHNVRGALLAQKLGVDYLGVSPIFFTGTKQDAGKPIGLEMLKKIKKNISLPIVAIGGINLSNTPEVILAGADAVSAISAVVSKADVKREILKFQQLFSQ